MRINLYGGPGVGKSALACWITGKLKMSGLDVEQSPEYVKDWAYEKREVKRYDQIYLFGKQLKMEYKFLGNGVKHIVSESPLFLNTCYAMKYMGKELADPLRNILTDFEKEYAPLNIYLERPKDADYDPEGRFETEDQAREMDRYIKEQLAGFYYGRCISFSRDNKKDILSYIKKHINDPHPQNGNVKFMGENSIKGY